MKDTAHITLAHGNGGRHMRELIEQLFAAKLASPVLNTDADASHIPLEPGQPLISTDGFTVQPLEFPGGNIGSLAIHGTVNDLAVAGADPKYLSLNAFIEEGLAMDQLSRIIDAMADAARETGIQIAAGDTKVVPKGQGSGIYLATTGIGIQSAGLSLGMSQIKPGDTILVSGPVGDHGTAVMLAREQFGLRGELHSDAASVLPLTRAIRGMDGLRFMRDPTRGGLATVAMEILHATGYGLTLEEDRIPVRDTVRSVCDILGYDPYYLACEGRVVAVIEASMAATALAAWQQLPQGEQAAIIGHINGGETQVLLQTSLGGERILEELEDDPLPRIC